MVGRAGAWVGHLVSAWITHLENKTKLQQCAPLLVIIARVGGGLLKPRANSREDCASVSLLILLFMLGPGEPYREVRGEQEHEG